MVRRYGCEDELYPVITKLSKEPREYWTVFEAPKEVFDRYLEAYRRFEEARMELWDYEVEEKA